MALKIICAPDPILNKISRIVPELNPEVKKFILAMQETMAAQAFPESVGLSAVQVGKLWQILIIQVKEKSPPEIIINPEILQAIDYSDEEYRKIEKDKNRPLEGCLSLPGMFAPIRRYKKVQLRYRDATWQVHEDWFENFRGVVLQHELDHLQGILFTQRAFEQGAPIYREVRGKLEEVGSSRA